MTLSPQQGKIAVLGHSDPANMGKGEILKASPSVPLTGFRHRWANQTFSELPSRTTGCPVTRETSLHWPLGKPCHNSATVKNQWVQELLGILLPHRTKNKRLGP